MKLKQIGYNRRLMEKAIYPDLLEQISLLWCMLIGYYAELTKPVQIGKSVSDGTYLDTRRNAELNQRISEILGQHCGTTLYRIMLTQGIYHDCGILRFEFSYLERYTVTVSREERLSEVTIHNDQSGEESSYQLVV